MPDLESELGAASSAGAQSELPKIGKVRGKEAFRRLRSSRNKAVRGTVRIAFIGGAGFDAPCFAFALNRKVGGAVVRNRIRRRIRAIAEEHRSQLAPGNYLVTASSETVKLSYGELRAQVSATLAAIARQDRA